jgi:hypothetical protein
MVISHDRWFLDRVATHILAYEDDGGVVFHEGNFSDYEEDRKRASAPPPISRSACPTANSSDPRGRLCLRMAGAPMLQCHAVSNARRITTNAMSDYPVERRHFLRAHGSTSRWRCTRAAASGTSV